MSYVPQVGDIVRAVEWFNGCSPARCRCRCRGVTVLAVDGNEMWTKDLEGYTQIYDIDGDVEWVKVIVWAER